MSIHKVFYSLVSILYSLLVNFIDNQLSFPTTYVVIVQVAPDEQCGIVSGGVINDYNLVVGVVLHEYRVEVELYPEMLVIVVARHNDAHG